MEASKILTADILDIIFDGRNKSYGAFDLRKNYDRRLMISLGTTVAITVLLLLGYSFFNSSDTITEQVVQIEDRVLMKVIKEEPVPIPKTVLKPAPLKAATSQYATIKIVPDNKMNENEKPPLVEELSKTQIGLIKQEGVESNDIVAPPANTVGKGIVEVVRKEKEAVDSVFTKVEIESVYPGGSGAWLRYLNKTFQYPQEAADNGTEGTVIVQFIIDREGNVSEVQAVSGPVSGRLRNEAERVIQKSGKWEPAIQNGRKVKSYKKQPITFRLGE